MFFKNNRLITIIDQKRSSHSTWIFILVCISTVIMAAYRLSDCALWTDETCSILIAQRTLPEIWGLRANLGEFYINTFPPLYETLLHFVWHPSGERQLVARGLSIAFSIGALIGIFRLAALLYDTQTALIASFLAGCNYMFLLHAKMIRGYALFTMLTVWSFYFFFSIYVTHRLSFKNSVLLLMLNTALLYVSYLGFAAIALQFLFAFWIVPTNVRRKFWLLTLLVVPLFLPWAERLLPDIMIESQRALGTAGSVWKVVLFRLQEGVFRSSLLPYAHIGIMITNTVLTLIFLWRRREPIRTGATIMLTAIAIIAPLGITWFTRNQFHAWEDASRARYLFPFLFPVFILSGYFIQRLPRRIGAGLFGFLLLLSTTAVYSVLNAPREYYWPPAEYFAAKMINDFPFPPGDKIAIEVNHVVTALPFTHAFFGPDFFYRTSFPYYGANLPCLITRGDTAYSVFYNYRWKINLHSISQVEEFDWLCLVSNNIWSKLELNDVYHIRLRNAGKGHTLRLVAHKQWERMSLFIYKVTASENTLTQQSPT